MLLPIPGEQLLENNKAKAIEQRAREPLKMVVPSAAFAIESVP